MILKTVQLLIALLSTRSMVVTNAFTPSSSSCIGSLKSSTMKKMSSTATEVSNNKGPRIIRDDLPIVHVYDHCPFCVRVRFALGVKNIKHTVNFLANDDIKAPTKLIGKKIAPIFEIPEDNLIMGESLDIIAKVDSDERFGTTQTLKPASSRTDLKEWQKSVQTLLRTLQRPRYVATGLLPEFQQIDGRHAFIKNHQLPPYEKKEWKADDSELTMDDKLKIYAEAMASDPIPLVEDLNAKLVELDDKIYCEDYCTEGGLSMDDVDMWSRLRSITIIKDVIWPDKLRAYMDNLSVLSDVPLYDAMAI